MRGAPLSKNLPTYKQLICEIYFEILNYSLESGDKISSIRETALEKNISPNTVAKSYKELESMGVLNNIPGKGTFIKELNDMSNKKISEYLKEEFQYIGLKLKTLNVSKKQLYDWVDEANIYDKNI